jgi:hypothetical protein
MCVRTPQVVVTWLLLSMVAMLSRCSNAVSLQGMLGSLGSTTARAAAIAWYNR